MPVELIEKVVELAGSSAAYRTHLALVLGLPSHQEGALDVARSLRDAGHRVRTLFLDASTAELVKRYGATRRKHPLDDGRGGVEDAVTRERTMLEPVKGAADMVIDTSAMTVHQLKSRIAEFFATAGSPDGMRIAVVSFGYKHGIPLDVANHAFQAPLSAHDPVVRLRLPKTPRSSEQPVAVRCGMSLQRLQDDLPRRPSASLRIEWSEDHVAVAWHHDIGQKFVRHTVAME
jgi:UPF0042 nucleotide-binding protein